MPKRLAMRKVVESEIVKRQMRKFEKDLLNWKDFDNLHVDDYLEFYELREFVKAIKSSRLPKLFKYDYGPVNSVFQSHPATSQRIVFLWDSVGEKEILAQELRANRKL